jgi:dephospho-CoA kinase
MNQKILKIGITGGIGSGKTTVCSIFETLAIPIYYADDRAKRLQPLKTCLAGMLMIQMVF